MTFTPRHTERVALSLALRLENTRVQEIKEPEPGTLIVYLRGVGHTAPLLLSVELGTNRFHLTEKKWMNAPSPPRFLQKARKELVGARLVSMESEPSSFSLFFVHGRSPDRPFELQIRLDSGGAILLLGKGRKILEEIYPTRGNASAPCPDFPPNLDDNEVHLWLDEHYSSHTLEATLESVKSGQLKTLRQALKRTKRKAENVRSDHEKAQNGVDEMAWGELLKPVARDLQKGQKEVYVIDYSHPEMAQVCVPLDPALSALENMKAYFKSGNRYRNAMERIVERIESVEKVYARLLEGLATLEKATTEDEVGTIMAGLPLPKTKKQGLPSTSKKGKQPPSSPFKEYRSGDGSRILVGRNAKANDRLTFGVARGNDWWLHARGRRGSHVVVPRAGKESTSGQVLRDAARLCAFYSEGGKADSNVEVWIVERKHVRKPKGAPAGSVTYSGGKCLWVGQDEEATRALLDSLVEE